MNVLANHVVGPFLSRTGFVRLAVCLMVSWGTLAVNVVEPVLLNQESDSSRPEQVERDANAKSFRLRQRASFSSIARRMACLPDSSLVCESPKIDAKANPNSLTREGFTREYFNFNGFGGPLRT